MSIVPSRPFPTFPRAFTMAGALSLKDRYSSGRGGRHVIVLGDCIEDREEYFVVTPGEARRLVEAGYELMPE